MGALPLYPAYFLWRNMGKILLFFFYKMPVSCMGPVNFGMVDVSARSMFEVHRWMSFVRFVENRYVYPSLLIIVQLTVFEILTPKDRRSHNRGILVGILQNYLSYHNILRCIWKLTLPAATLPKIIVIQSTIFEIFMLKDRRSEVPRTDRFMKIYINHS